MRLIILLCALAIASSAAAQDCTPHVTTPRLYSGPPGMQIVPPLSDETAYLVPAGTVEVVLDASVGNEQGYGLTQLTEVAIVKEIFWGAGSWWIQGIAKTAAPVTTTPNLAISNARGIAMLFPGQRLAARAAISSSSNIYIMYSSITFPLECLARFQGLAAPPASGGTTTVMMPNFALTLQGTAQPTP